LLKKESIRKWRRFFAVAARLDRRVIPARGSLAATLLDDRGEGKSNSFLRGPAPSRERRGQKMPAGLLRNDGKDPR
jgi:hypothetical protein